MESSSVCNHKSDRVAGVRIVYHEYDYRPNWTTRKSYYQLIIKITISKERRIAKLRKKGTFALKNDKGGVNCFMSLSN